MKSRFTRWNTAVGAIALAVGLVIGTAGGGFAGDGMPADKTAVGGSAVKDIGPDAEHVILSQRMKVSSPADLILGVTAECTILTRLITENGPNKTTAETSGSVVLRVNIDGKDVPIQTAGFKEGDPADDGRVTFCNRTYQRTVTNQEDDLAQKIDRQDDYIRTKNANGFNWVALNVGVDKIDGGYDDLANGNNIIDIVVYARYDHTGANEICGTASPGATCSEAYVGKRTLVIEPVHAAVNEQSEPAGAPADSPFVTLP